jgi:hypothetical protein
VASAQRTCLVGPLLKNDPATLVSTQHNNSIQHIRSDTRFTAKTHDSSTGIIVIVATRNKSLSFTRFYILSFFISAPKNVFEENERLKNQLTCKICMDNASNMVFIPCGHMISCETCAPHIRKCAICRKLIEGRVKAFMS